MVYWYHIIKYSETTLFSELTMLSDYRWVHMHVINIAGKHVQGLETFLCKSTNGAAERCDKCLCGMGLLPDTWSCGLRMRRECSERFPRHRLQRKPPVSDPGMHHGTCVTHVPWCTSGSLTRDGGENVPGIPGACATRNFKYLARGPWEYLNIRLRTWVKSKSLYIGVLIWHGLHLCWYSISGEYLN